MDKLRTPLQNDSLHLYFRHVAQALNESGNGFVKTVRVMREGFEMEWTETLVKEVLWKEIQKTMYKKVSTTQLSKHEEIDMIHDVLNRFLGERMGIEHIPFPRDPMKE